jgi:selenocysteine lyase/cysteine desulfurase
MDGISVQGITDKEARDRRVPTVSFTHRSKQPDVIAKALAQNNIFVWSGYNYAHEVAKALDVFDSGGVVRIGPVHYNSLDEIDELLNVLHSIISA